MKKSIFLFFAAILCAMTANAQWYLMGTVTDWSSGKQMTGDSKVVSVTINLAAKTNYELKIKSGKTWYGNGGTMTSTNNLVWEFSSSNGSNAKITTTDAGDYTFTWYISDKKLSVTYPNHNYIIAGDGAVMEDDWSPSSTNNKMSKQDDGTYRLTKTNRSLSVKTYGYKLTVGSWDVNQYPNDNVALKVTTAGNYNVVFTYNPKNGQLSHELVPIYTITASANPATAGVVTGAGTYAKDASVTLEATPNAGYKFVNWTVGGEEKSTETTYSFTASADVTAVANFELSDPEVPTYAISVSANNDAMGTVTGAGDYTEGSPVTLTATPNAGYRFVNWTVGSEVKSTEATYSFTASEALTIVANFEAIPKYDITVKAVVPEAWTSATIGIHYWGDGITGTSTPVATEKEGNWNKYTIKDVLEGQSVNVIFLNGTSWGSDKSKQTANITGITEDKCFQISAKTLDGEGKCTFTEVDCAADIKPEGDVYTIMGAGELGLSWDLAQTGNDMTKQADGTYTLVKEGLDLATTGTYEYKVVKNHSWDWSIPSGNTNQTLKVDKDGTYTVTFTLSADKKKLTATPECTAEKEVILDCFVAGTTKLVGGTTDFTDKLPMAYDADSKTYSKTFTALPAGNYQMKVVYGSDWLGFDKLATPVPANVTEGDDKKIKFTLAEAGDVTVTYNATNGIGLVGNFVAPLPPVISYVLMGVAEDWTTGITMTRNEDNTDFEEYMLLGQTISATDAVKVVKLVDGEKNTFCGDVKDGSAEYTTDGDGNIVLAEGTYDFYYDVPANKVYIGKQVAPTTIDVTLYGMVATPNSRMGSYRFLSLDDEDGNRFSIYNGSEGVYGNDLEVTGYLAEYEVTVSGTGDWQLVDGVETLTATLQVEEDNTTIYNVVATVGAATTITLECRDATYTITDPEYNEVTFTGVADGKEFTILVSYFGGEYYSEGEWGETFIFGTEVEFDDSDAESYYLGGTYVDDANNTYEVAISGTPAAVDPETYTRTVTPGNFGTICLPFGSTNYTGMELFECVGKETGKVYIASVTTLKAGVPYIFLATDTELAVYSDGTVADEAGKSNGLYGTFDDETVVAEGDYILYNNELRESDGNAKVNANRAYLVMEDVPAGAPQQMPGRKYIGMSTKGENATTGLDNITNGENTTIKVIENGQLIIIRNGEKFNAQGVRF